MRGYWLGFHSNLYYVKFSSIVEAELMADLTVDSNLSGSVDSHVSGSISVGTVTIGGIPDTYNHHIKEIAKIQFGMDPVESKIQFEPVTLKLAPVESIISLKEIPSVRTHLPANYSIAFSFYGVEIAALHLRGEGQIITEPYRPNPCERCGGVTASTTLDTTLIRGT
jgi:hypothetical protein